MATGSENFMCWHTEIEVADYTFYLTQSQCIDTGGTGPSADPITPGAWQDSHWITNYLSTQYDSTPPKDPRRKWELNPSLLLSRWILNHYANKAVRERERERDRERERKRE